MYLFCLVILCYFTSYSLTGSDKKHAFVRAVCSIEINPLCTSCTFNKHNLCFREGNLLRSVKTNEKSHLCMRPNKLIRQWYMCYQPPYSMRLALSLAYISYRTWPVMLRNLSKDVASYLTCCVYFIYRRKEKLAGVPFLSHLSIRVGCDCEKDDESLK